VSPQTAPPVRVAPLRRPDTDDAADAVPAGPDRKAPHPTPSPGDPLRTPSAGSARSAAATAMQQGQGNAAMAKAVEGPMDAFWGPRGYDPAKARGAPGTPGGASVTPGTITAPAGAPLPEVPGAPPKTGAAAPATPASAAAQAKTAATAATTAGAQAAAGTPVKVAAGKTTDGKGAKGEKGLPDKTEGGDKKTPAITEPVDAFFGAAGLTPPPAGGAPIGGEADVTDAAAWAGGVKAAAQGMPRPALPSGAKQLQAAGKAVQQKGEADNAALATTAPKLVPPAPRVQQPLPPPPDPVPDATALVTTAAAKKLDPIELPAFQATPRSTRPEIPRALAPPPPPPPPSPTPTTVPGKSAVTAAQQQAAAAQKMADEPPATALPATVVPGYPTTVTDERETSFTLPRPLTLQVGAVIADLLQNPGAIASAALTQARLLAYPGGILKTNIPDYGNDEILPRLTTTVTERLTALARIAGMGAEELQLSVAERRMQLEEDKAAKDNVLDATAEAARTTARTQAKKKLTTIATQQHTADVAAGKRLRAAAWSKDPKVIEAVRDDIISRLQADAGKARAAHKRAGETRVSALTGWEGIYSTAYRGADDKDSKELSKGGTGVRVNIDKTTKRPWLTVRLEEVHKDFEDKRATADTSSKALQEDAGKAGANAVEQVRDWAAEKIGVTRDEQERTTTASIDKIAQAKADTQAWADLQAEEARNALLGDLIAVGRATKDLRADVDAAAITYDAKVTEDQKAATKKFFGDSGKVNPLAKLAANVQARFVSAELDGLKTELRNKLDKTAITEANLATVGVVAFGNTSPTAVERAHKLNTALSKLDTDEATVYQMLGGLVPRQVEVLHVTYQVWHHRNLTDHIFQEMWEDEAERDRAMQLLKGDRTAIAASAVHEGISGLGTNKATITEALRGKTPTEMEAIAKYYKAHYGETLEEAIKGDFSGKEKESVLALAAGDTPRADAIALDGACRSLWGKDLAAVRNVYKTIRDEVAADVQKNHPDWTTAQVQAEVARRNAEVDAKYTTEFGAEIGGKGTYDSPLKKVFAENLGKEGNDLAVALADVDPAGEDAARLALAGTHQEVGEDTKKSILADPYKRSLEAVRRDESDRIRKEMRAAAVAKHPGKTLTREEAQAEERQIQHDVDTEIERLARIRSKQEMDAVKGRFDAKYTREWGGTQDQPGVVGGLDTMLEQTVVMENDRNEVKAWVKQGYLTPEQEIRFAVEEYGTDEDRIKKTFRGKTADEVDAIRKAYKKEFNEDLDTRLKSELGGRDLFDVQEEMRGEPETPQQRIEAARRRYNYEKTNYPGVRFFGLAEDERAVLDLSMKDAEKTYADLSKKDISNDERDRLEAQLGRHTQNVDSAVELYRAGVDRVVDTAVQIVGIAVAVIVGAAIEAVTFGGATPVIAAALAMSLTGTAATIATKAILLGGAYGLEDFGTDLAIGVVDAIVAVATAGLGNKLLGLNRAAGATKATGVLARGYAAGGARRLAAKAVTVVIEQTAQALPSALAGNLLNDDNYRGNNPFGKMVKNTLTQTAHSVGMGLALMAPQHAATKGLTKVFQGVGRSFGALRSFLGRPPSHEVNLAHATSANPKERWGAWKEFQERYPGASREDFVAAVERGQTEAGVRADAERAFAREAKRQMLALVPPEIKARIADTPIRVLTEAEFKALGRSEKGQAFIRVADGKREIVMHEGTPISSLREEGVHLWQAVDPETAAMVARLDEAKLGKWDSLTIGEKVELYKDKMALELDAQRRIEAELRRRIEDKSVPWEQRADFVSDLEASRRTSEVLGERLREVHALGPADLAAIADGRQKLPQYLDQPARLFSKAYVYGGVSMREITPPGAEGGVRKYLVGESYRGKTPGGSVRRLRKVIVVEPGKPPRLVVEVFRTNKVWAQHGSLNVYEGQVGEAASRYVSEQEAEKAAVEGKLHVPVSVQTPTGAGFDQVILVFEKNAAGKDVARILILEAKNYKNRYVPGEDMTAIDDNFEANRDELRRRLMAADAAQKLRITEDQVAAALEAITEGKFDVQLRIGPTTGLGTLESGSILKELQAELLRYGEEVRVLDPHPMTEADIAEGRRRVAKFEGFPTRFADRVAQLAVTPAGISDETLRQAHAVARAEETGKLVKPVSRSPVPDRFYDGLNRPVDAVRLARAGFDPATTAAGLLDRLNRSDFLAGSKVQQDAVRVVLDATELTRAQYRDLKRELAQQAADRGMPPHVLETRLAWVPEE
jgi:hypothetical protein